MAISAHWASASPIFGVRVGCVAKEKKGGRRKKRKRGPLTGGLDPGDTHAIEESFDVVHMFFGHFNESFLHFGNFLMVPCFRFGFVLFFVSLTVGNSAVWQKRRA